MSAERGVPQVRLVDGGLVTPDHLVGQTGVVRVEMPDIEIEYTYGGDGVQEISELVVFPPTDKEPVNLPEGYVRIQGTLYEVVDDRDLNECPHCGSDKVDATADDPKCYDCDQYVDGDADE